MARRTHPPSSPPSCQLRFTLARYKIQRCNSSPSPHIPSTTSVMSATSSEDSFFGDRDYLDDVSLPFAFRTKTLGRRRRTLFATAALFSLLFLASHFTVQRRASDRFADDLEPFPFSPEELELPSNETYPITPRYSGVRGPPTPYFRGVCLSAAVDEIFNLPNIDNLLPDKQYLTSWPSAGWSESHCCPLPFVPCSPPPPRALHSERRNGLRKFTHPSLPS